METLLLFFALLHQDPQLFEAPQDTAPVIVSVYELDVEDTESTGGR